MKVGTGSSEHDLTGDVIMTRRTLAPVKGWNEANDVDARLLMSGGGLSGVADRMSSIFTKKSAKPSAL